MLVNAIIKPLDDIDYEFYFNDYKENFNFYIYDKNNRKQDDEIQHIINMLENSYSYYGIEKNAYYYNNMKGFLQGYEIKKENNKNFSNKEINIIKSVIINYNNNNEPYFLLDAICKVLSLCKHKKYTYKRISGYSQGEIAYLIYIKDILIYDDINIIEALYFGGCHKVLHTSDKIEDNNIEDIYNCIYNSFITAYDTSYNIKEKIKEFYKLTQLKEDIQIKLYRQSEKQVIKYEYCEV